MRRSHLERERLARHLPKVRQSDTLADVPTLRGRAAAVVFARVALLALGLLLLLGLLLFQTSLLGTSSCTFPRCLGGILRGKGRRRPFLFLLCGGTVRPMPVIVLSVVRLVHTILAHLLSILKHSAEPFVSGALL